MQPSPDPIRALEDRIEAGDADAMTQYTTDAFQNHLFDRDELHRRRSVLGRSVPEINTPIECIALLSAAMDDRAGWDKMLGFLEEEGDPGLGFLAWRLILFYSKDQQRADNWMHAVEHSARLGHFPSRHQVLLRDVRRSGFISGLKLRWHILKLERERQDFERVDPSSRLLARYSEDSKSGGHWMD